MVEAVKTSGLRNVVAGESSISTIDGERGILSYRGIDIHELARHSTFEEVVYLLHQGSLPTRERAAGLHGAARARARRPRCPARGAARAAADHASHDHAPHRGLRAGRPRPRRGQDDGLPATARKAIRLVAQMATAGGRHRPRANGPDPVAPDAQLSPRRQLPLHAVAASGPRTSAARAMDVALILHADHEFNASTFAARVAASTLADMHGAITAALATLKGPLHGGANEAVMQMLEEIGRAGARRGVGARDAGRQAQDHGLRPRRLQDRGPARHPPARAVRSASARRRGQRKWYE